MLRMGVLDFISAMHAAVTLLLPLLGVRVVGDALLAPRKFSCRRAGGVGRGRAQLARERRGRAVQGDNYPGQVQLWSRRADGRAGRAGRARGGKRWGGQGRKGDNTCEWKRICSSSRLLCRIPESKHHNPDMLRIGILEESVPCMMQFKI
jgi:hypothetical protein